MGAAMTGAHGCAQGSRASVVVVDVLVLAIFVLAIFVLAIFVLAIFVVVLAVAVVVVIDVVVLAVVVAVFVLLVVDTVVVDVVLILFVFVVVHAVVVVVIIGVVVLAVVVVVLVLGIVDAVAIAIDQDGVVAGVLASEHGEAEGTQERNRDGSDQHVEGMRELSGGYSRPAAAARCVRENQPDELHDRPRDYNGPACGCDLSRRALGTMDASGTQLQRPRALARSQGRMSLGAGAFRLLVISTSAWSLPTMTAKSLTPELLTSLIAALALACDPTRSHGNADREGPGTCNDDDEEEDDAEGEENEGDDDEQASDDAEGDDACGEQDDEDEAGDEGEEDDAGEGDDDRGENDGGLCGAAAAVDDACEAVYGEQAAECDPFDAVDESCEAGEVIDECGMAGPLDDACEALFGEQAPECDATDAVDEACEAQNGDAD
ncbi:MAG TPA: hypothetical protein VG755_21965 [Nannocystaceae bacterium]|nr:hypothetical protein [Nannocystaceae bacterium]